MSRRIGVTYDDETYDEITRLAAIENKSRSDIVREWSILGLKGNLNIEHIDLMTKIIREQLSSILDPQVNRLASLSAKTCIQSTTAAYLTAETILKFVPEHMQEDVEETYEKARKKAIYYTKRPLNSTEREG